MEGEGKGKVQNRGRVLFRWLSRSQDFIRFHHGEFIVKREKIVVARDKLT